MVAFAHFSLESLDEKAVIYVHSLCIPKLFVKTKICVLDIGGQPCRRKRIPRAFMKHISRYNSPYG